MITRAFTEPCCAWAALRLLRERESAQPRRIAAGRMTVEDAADRLATARAIVAQWRWTIDPALSPFPTDPCDPAPFGAAQVSMVAQLRETVAWERSRASTAPADELLEERARLAEALLYYQDAPAGAHPLIVRYGFAARRSPSQRFAIDPEQDGWAYTALGLALPASRRAA